MSIGPGVRERSELSPRLRAAADASDMRRVGSSLAELEYLFELVVSSASLQQLSHVLTRTLMHWHRICSSEVRDEDVLLGMDSDIYIL